jgi:hypothetical protein
MTTSKGASGEEADDPAVEPVTPAFGQKEKLDETRDEPGGLAALDEMLREEAVPRSRASREERFSRQRAEHLFRMSNYELEVLIEPFARHQKNAYKELRNRITNRTADAYIRGINDATDRNAIRSYRARSIVLLLVVLSVVAMPIIAMVININPETFAAYIAPVTAIAGTVIGYWFGASDRQPGSRQEL